MRNLPFPKHFSHLRFLSKYRSEPHGQFTMAGILVVHLGKGREELGKVNQPHAAYVVRRCLGALGLFLKTKLNRMKLLVFNHL